MYAFKAITMNDSLVKVGSWSKAIIFFVLLFFVSDDIGYITIKQAADNIQ